MAAFLVLFGYLFASILALVIGGGVVLLLLPRSIQHRILDYLIKKEEERLKTDG